MAISIAPSYNFGGNDGAWSTFYVKVGTSAQQMEVLPATSQSYVAVVLAAGCPTDYGSGCNMSRGGIFDPAADVSWDTLKPADGGNYFTLPLETFEELPGYAGVNAYVGLDAMSLDWSGDTVPSFPLQDQVIAGYAAANPWLGMLGLSGNPTHLNSSNVTATQISPLQSLLVNQSVYSLSWGYTAGAYGEASPAYGSLTLGGYDAARRDDNSLLTVALSSVTSRELQVALTEITISDISSPAGVTVSGLGANGIITVIDSVVPEIWLPSDTCDSIASILGLEWNDTMQLYPVNESQHTALQDSQTFLEFFLNEGVGAPGSFSVKLPYSAFDMNVSYPYAGVPEGETIRYFPMQQAANTSEYYLGRTFLQYA